MKRTSSSLPTDNAAAWSCFPVEWLLSLVFAERRKTITIGALVLLAPLAVYSLVNGRRSPAVAPAAASAAA